VTPPDFSTRAASAEEVLACVRQLCTPLEAERAPLAEALGRALREPVLASEDQPPFDRSAVDGFAVRLDDRQTSFHIVDEIRAGEWKPRALQLGEAVRIATGGALPGEGLQVVMKEAGQAEGTTVRIMLRTAARNIRFRGDDCRAGQVLVEAGMVLQAGTLSLLASIGHAQPLVTRLPRVLHVATGNEIVPPEQAPGPGQIRDSNSTLVRAFFQSRGIESLQHRIGEDESAVEAAFVAGARAADIVLISGGASVGEHDFTGRVLERQGFTLHVSKTTTRPGKPLIVAQRDRTIAFGLPGNPLAHFVCLNLYVRAALEAFSGRPTASLFQRGVLAVELPADVNARETFWPAVWGLEAATVKLTPLPWASSGDLTSLARANALIRVPIGATRMPEGGEVEFVCTSTAT
jgi:molybdopterin molybdotransferase